MVDLTRDKLYVHEQNILNTNTTTYAVSQELQYV